MSGVTISLLRCGAATLVLFLPSSIVSPIRVKALGYGQVPVWWGGQCGGVASAVVLVGRAVDAWLGAGRMMLGWFIQ